MNKDLYKVTLFILKLLPMIMAFSYMSIGLCAWLGVGWQIFAHYIGLVITPITFMYICSYLFKFCNYHRVFLHYVAITELVNITDWYFKIPVSNTVMGIIHLIITVVFLITFVIMYIRKQRQIKICNKNAESSN